MSKPSCACRSCQALCAIYPGWLSPRDVRRLARHLGVTEASLFTTHLAIDTWYGYPDDLYVAIPINYDGGPGEVTDRPMFGFSTGYRNACRLWIKGRCSIHAAKPRECRENYSTDCATLMLPTHRGISSMGIERSRIARAWNRPGVQDWLRDLRDAADELQTQEQV